MALILFVLLAGTSVAQPVVRVQTYSVSGYRQYSATETKPFGHKVSFELAVGVNSRPTTEAKVRLKFPNGGMQDMVPDTDTYWIEADFPDHGAASAAYPDGTYTALISLGGNEYSHSFSYFTTTSPLPTKITNFDELASCSRTDPKVNWSSIGRYPIVGAIIYTVEKEDGTTVFSQDTYTYPVMYYAECSNLPWMTPLTGSLINVWATENKRPDGSHSSYSVVGFWLEHPIFCRPALPAANYPPSDTVVRIGDKLDLRCTAAVVGPFSYQWYKDGKAIPGATGVRLEAVLNTPVTDVDVAGSYTVVFTNLSGSVESQPALVGVKAAYSARAFVAGDPGWFTGAPTTQKPTINANRPYCIASDPAGNLYLANQTCIQKINTNGELQWLSGYTQYNSYIDGPASRACYQSIGGLAVDAAGNLYVAERLSHTIRKVAPDGSVVTFAGKQGTPGNTDGSLAEARFNYPIGLAFDRSGTLYVCDYYNHCVRTITPDGRVGTLHATELGADAASRKQPLKLLNPILIAVGPANDLFILHGSNRMFDMYGYNIVRISADGHATLLTNTLASPIGLAVDGEGFVYVRDEQSLLRFNPQGMQLSDCNPFRTLPTDMVFSIQGLATESSGKILALDYYGTLLRLSVNPGKSPAKLAFDAYPQSMAIAENQNVLLKAGTIGSNLEFRWRINGSLIRKSWTDKEWPYNRSYQWFGIERFARADAGAYSMVVSDGISSIETPPAVLQMAEGTLRGRMANLSVRAYAGTASKALILGYAVAGDKTDENMRVLMRGVGPTLGSFGVTGSLPDPTLALFSGVKQISENDDWDAGLADNFTAVGAFPFVRKSRDAAFLATQTAGLYTVQLRGKDDTTGQVLAEIYDMGAAPSGSATPRLSNISARVYLDNSAGTLVAGLVVNGPTGVTVLLRALGRSVLYKYGIEDGIPEPQIILYRGDKIIATNSPVGSGDLLFAAAKSRLGGSVPNHSSEDIVLTLNPGVYTVHVSNKVNYPGTVLFELYEIPN